MKAEYLTDLLHLDRALTPAERRLLNRKPKKSLHAAPMGSGPEGETCGSCGHLARVQHARVYLKCGHPDCRPKWTGGPGTDVRAKDPACSKWEKPDGP